MDKAAVYSFMKGCRYAVVSSLPETGAPQSAVVGIAVTPDLEIVFDTVNFSRKYRNLTARPSCSAVVGGGVDGERTVQYEGLAREPQGAELQHYQDAYFAAWPDGRARTVWPGIAYFVLRPEWIRYSDFKQNPALIEEIRFAL